MNIDINKICYLFDVDGTLTNPREKITNSFKEEFKRWASGKQLFIGTGSDFAKTKQQLSQDVLNQFQLIFCCMGNETRNSAGVVLERNVFKDCQKLESDLEKFLTKSQFNVKTGRHLEYRTGMVNFSIVGRNANQQERKSYNKWDSKFKEREQIARYINENYPNYEASIGGSISIDIIMKGKDKGQIIQHLTSKGIKKLVFLGDRCLPGGNDYGIIKEFNRSNLAFEWYQVSGPDHVLTLIKNNKVFF